MESRWKQPGRESRGYGDPEQPVLQAWEMRFCCVKATEIWELICLCPKPAYLDYCPKELDFKKKWVDTRWKWPGRIKKEMTSGFKKIRRQVAYEKWYLLWAVKAAGGRNWPSWIRVQPPERQEKKWRGKQRQENTPWSSLWKSVDLSQEGQEQEDN